MRQKGSIAAQLTYPTTQTLGLLLASLLPACTMQSIPADLASGIEGTMLAGPQCPVAAPGMLDDCDDQPYQGTVIVKTSDGLIEVTRFTADEAGQFRVPLFPGRYLLDPLPGPNGLPAASPQFVEVQENTFTRVDISYDTGIR